jgi:GNAT superfamily N-acetyltransferase
MVIQVEPLIDVEYEEYTRLQYAAFRSSGGISSFIFPTETPVDAMHAIIEKGQRKMRETSNAHYAKVTDSGSAQLLAIAHWKVFDRERTIEEQQAFEKTRSPLPGVNHLAWNDYYGHVQQSRQKLGTRPCLTVHIFATHPAHRRKGHGAMLLQHILTQADEYRLEVYLEASEEGKLLYEKFGFQLISEKDFHLEKYGGFGTDRNTIMIRPAKVPADAKNVACPMA